MHTATSPPWQNAGGESDAASSMLVLCVIPFLRSDFRQSSHECRLVPQGDNQGSIFCRHAPASLRARTHFSYIRQVYTELSEEYMLYYCSLVVV